MEADARTRLGWIKLYEEVGNAGLVCRRCGISRPTLRKWVERHQQRGLDGLVSESRRPDTSPLHESPIVSGNGSSNCVYAGWVRDVFRAN